MRNKKFISTAGVTPAKLILIGVLAVILIGVIVYQLSDSTPAPQSAQSEDRGQSGESKPAQSPTNPSAPAMTATSASNSAQRAWPVRPLENVLAYDPFAPPLWTGLRGELDGADDVSTADGTEDVSQAAKWQLLADLQTQGVSLVMISGGDRLAKIGETELREGDLVGGFVVQEINANGVVLVEYEAH